jgi:tRNA threonylcarbamoyladenosine biosynthesis protein TsaE
MLTIEASTQEQQEQIGAALASVCPTNCVIYLKGDLGAGKTTLVRGFLRGLGYQGAVKSPTYTLMEPYEIGDRHCYHFDLYRLADPGELEYLGLRDLLTSDAVLLFEWPDRGEGELPNADLVVDIEYKPDGRSIKFIANSEIAHLVIQKLNRTIEHKKGRQSNWASFFSL